MSRSSTTLPARESVLVTGGRVVTCDPDDRVVDGDVLIEDGRITAIGPDALSKRSRPGLVRVLDASGCAVLPGFVQPHIHLCQTLFRGMADDLPLLDWLRERVWPLEAAHDERSLAASAELGLLELVLGGTTTLLDMGTVSGHDAVFDACARSGLRVFSGKAMMDSGAGVPKGLRETTRRSLDESDALFARWDGAAEGRLRYAYAPRFILSCTEGLFRGVVERARENGAKLHSHAAEHPGERRAVRELLGQDDVDVLESYGFCGENTLLAHGVQLTKAQERRAAKLGTRFIHCPSSNLKLGSGIARVADLLASGVKVGLAADGAPCTNNLDAFTELRHAALLAKTRSGTTSLPARHALRLATVLGAEALGIADQVGSLEPGKRADLQVVRVDGPHVEPGGDVFSRLVYACRSSDIVHVLVDGRLLVKLGESRVYDRERVTRVARVQGDAVRARAGL
ncbi:MAG: amidohydrolase family protein [Myxococcales bacterium]|nr:amidohydrolase family protein [Myxococcales bacterium]HQY63895.1 amidohydrolase family protein [Polyangiaceae bacterium]